MIQFTHMPDARWLAAGAVMAAVVVFASYLTARGSSPRWLRSTLAGGRWLIIAAVTACLLNPQWVEEIQHDRKSRVAVLVDTSRSMGTKDVPQGRLAAARNWLGNNLADSPPPGATVEYYTFDKSLARASGLDALSAQGEVTGLAEALDTLLAAPREDPLLGVLLCSDGIENMRGDAEAMAKLYRRKGIPIHTLAVGTTNDARDIIVENVQVKRAVPNQAPAKVGISLRSRGYAGQVVPVHVLKGKELVASHAIRLKDGAQRLEVNLTPRAKGFQVFEVQVPAQPGEWLASNNRSVFGLEVVDPTIRVLYMEGTPQNPGSPMPEWKYLKDALESDANIKVKTLYRRFGNNGQFLNTVDTDPETGEKIYPVEHATKGFPRTLAGLLEYDVVIHSDIRTDSFTGDQLKNMARLVEEHGGGFVMIGGNSAFGKGGYHRTVLDRLIPVAMEQEADSQARPFHPQVPVNALSHPIIALGATRQETELIWGRKFPLLYGCNLVDRAKPGAVVLAVDPTMANAYGPRVILAVQNVGRGRTMAFTSDTTRTWGKDFETTWGERIIAARPLSEENCDSRYYRQFWVNAARWLAAARLSRTNSPVSLEIARSHSLPGERVAASVVVRDKESRIVSDAEVLVLLSSTSETNRAVKAVFDRASQAYLLDLVATTAGDYMVTAAATAKGQKLGEDRQLLVCESGDRELGDLRARPDLMAAIASASGGRALSVSENSAVEGASLFNTAPPPAIERRHTPMWDRWWWLSGILAALTIEWSVRRLKGLA
jgi:uncharacterized membrane protein